MNVNMLDLEVALNSHNFGEFSPLLHMCLSLQQHLY